jgi:hypothetical protein
LNPQSNMKLPTIHLNGTSAKSLAESYQFAATELSSALTALENVELNGRDYYPQGQEAWSQAREEYIERCRKLKNIVDEVQAIADHCWEAVK